MCMATVGMCVHTYVHVDIAHVHAGCSQLWMLVFMHICLYVCLSACVCVYVGMWHGTEFTSTVLVIRNWRHCHNHGATKGCSSALAYCLAEMGSALLAEQDFNWHRRPPAAAEAPIMCTHGRASRPMVSAACVSKRIQTYPQLLEAQTPENFVPNAHPNVCTRVSKRI